MENMEMNLNFWQNKKVLITGCTGFKGSWLSIWLQSLGANVLGYSLNLPTNPSLFTIADVEQGMTHILGDIRDTDQLNNTFSQFKPEIVIHMAAQSLVRYSYLNPIETYSVNVMGTVNLFEAVRQCNSVKALINVTSDKCYENQERLSGYRENEAMGGHDPYSNSKGCSELVTAAYRNSYFNEKNYNEHGVAIASVRAGNVIGGGDWSSDRLVPDIIKNFVTNKKLSVRYPNAIRPWQHVLEPLRGYLLLAEKLYCDGVKYSGPWNFGPNDEDSKSVSCIVNEIANIWGDKTEIIYGQNLEPHEASILQLDITKAQTDLGWSPIIKLDETLKMIVEWYKGYYEGYEMNEFTLKQISLYQKKMELFNK
jgi:CDP-glucose 4,6-dehydratase